jgi:PAS domain S-box-containing protein
MPLKTKSKKLFGKKLSKKDKNIFIYEKLVSNVSYQSIIIKNFDDFIDNILKNIGEKLNVCRAYVFKINNNNTASNSHEWCNKGIKKQKQNLQTLPLKIYEPWMKLLYNNKIIKIDNTKLIKNKGIRKVITDQQIKALLLVPIITKEGLYGFIGLDKCVKATNWNNQQIKTLKVIANIISQTLNNNYLQNKIYNLKEHYKQIVDTIQDGIFVINDKFKVISCNKAFAKKMHLPIKKIIGSPCSEITAKYDNNLLKDHCKQHVKNNSPEKHGCIIAKVFVNKKAMSFVEKNIDEKGLSHYHRISVFPALNNKKKVDRVVTTIKNLTTEMRAEEEFRNLSEFNQSILDNIPVSIITINKKGEVTSTNKFFFELTGSKEFTGGNIYNNDFFRRENLIKRYRKLFQTGKIFYKPNCKTSDNKGNVKYLNIIAAPLRNKIGKITGAVSMAIDNTETVLNKKEIENLNKGLEKKIEERTRQLDRTNKKLHKTLDLKSKFIADTSHELRTPLTIIQGNLDLLNKEYGKDNKEILTSVERMKKEIKLMSEILSDLSLLSSDKTNIMKMGYEKIELSNLISILCKSLKILADKKKIKIKYYRSVKTIIMGDESNIEKLLINILRNAIKYGKNNGQIKIKIKKLKEKVIISISDNGIGIPKKDLPNIFGRFYRVSKSRSRNEGGTGLGLAIAKWIVEGHKGYIEVESKLNKGSIFHINLPYDYRKKTLI